MDRIASTHSVARSSGSAADTSGGRLLAGAGEPCAVPAGGSAARIRRPQTRAATIVRREMLARLTAIGDDVSLVLVVAPGGYGKTTALAQWVKADDRPAGWIQLEEADNDPTTLARDIASAVAEAQGLGHECRAALSAIADAGEGGAVAELIKFLRTMDKPALLVLDDLSHVRRSVALDMVVSVATNLPAGWQVAVASQRRSRLRVGRLRSQGRVVEFGPKDLAFSTTEAREVLLGLGLALPDATVQAIVTHTEGWPAGVCLAALSMAGRPDPAAAADELTGDSRYIVDYFRDEVLTRESAEAVRFLLRTSVLDRFCGSLCDAVLDTTGSATRLHEIEALNLFMVPEDSQGQWYRYHRLFREMLQSQLRSREPGEERRIRLRASAWYESHEAPEQAIVYAVAAGDDARAARLITAHTQQLHAAGGMSRVRSWLDALDEDVVRSYPPLAAIATWIWALTGDAARAQWSLRAAESGSFDGPLPDGSASLTSAVHRARAALAPDGIEAMRADGRRAVELEPPGSPWHTMAALLYGCACVFAGARDEAVQEFERAARLGRQNATPGASFALAQRALLAAEEGDWTTAAACAEDSRRLVDSAGLQTSLSSLTTYLANARVALHRGDAPAALTATAGAQRLYRRPSPVAFPWLGAQTAILMGRTLLDLGDQPAAEVKATDAGRHLALLPVAGALRDQLHGLLVDLERARSRTEAAEGVNLSAAELRILPLLPTYLSLGDIARELEISRNTVKTEVAAIYRKLDVKNRKEAVRRALDIGLLKP
jgi:LuxR family transcriptional regulator, maltose regulon positive regulatory protein